MEGSGSEPYCIEMDGKRLLENLSPCPGSVTLQKVSYGQEDQAGKLHYLLDDVWEKVVGNAGRELAPWEMDEASEAFAEKVWEKMTQIRVTSKSRRFSLEKESRFIVEVDPRKIVGDRLRLGYVFGENGGCCPCLEWHFGEEGKSIVKRIITCREPGGKDVVALRFLMDACGFL